MSKKQKEKVEYEMQFHQAQLRQQRAIVPEGSGYDPQIHSSYRQRGCHRYSAYGKQPSGYTPGGQGAYPQARLVSVPTVGPTLVYINKVGYAVHSRTMFDPRSGHGLNSLGGPQMESAAITGLGSGGMVPVMQGDPGSSSVGPVELRSVDNRTFPTRPATQRPQLNPAQISELMRSRIADAHAQTCLYPLAYIHAMFRTPNDFFKLQYYTNMAREQLWLECAETLTNVIVYIVEFAKMVPGFLKLSQNDQIVLSKAACPELAILRMSRYYDLMENAVLYGDTMLRQDVFYTTDTTAIQLVMNAFEFVKGIAQLRLTETELALYSAYVLFSPDRPGLEGLEQVGRLSGAVFRALRTEMDRNHVQPINGDVTVCDALLAKIPDLRDLSALHLEVQAKFKRLNPHLAFPPLHMEMFSVDDLTEPDGK